MTCCRRFLIGLVGTSRSQGALDIEQVLDAEYAFA